MRIFFNILGLLSSIIVETTSSHGTEPQYCNWETIYTASIKKCYMHCLSVRGFHHPISKELICIEEKSVAKPVFIVKHDFGFYDCKCVDDDSTDHVNCNPERIFERFKLRQCHETCEQYTVYKFVKNNKAEVYCEESSKVEEFSLDFLASKEDRWSKDGGKMYHAYACKCGLNLKELQNTREFKKRGRKKKERPTNLEKIDEFLLRCPIESSALPNIESKDYFCSDKCSTYMGYNRDNNGFLCFNRIDSAIDISKNYEPCQCGYYRYARRKERVHCTPNLTFPSITDPKLCKKECSTYIILRKYVKKALESLWCGKISNPYDVYMTMDWSTQKNWERKRHSSYICTCGLKTLNRDNLLSFIVEKNSRNEVFPAITQFGEILSTDEEIIFTLNRKQYVKTRIGFERSRVYLDDLAHKCQMEAFPHQYKSRCISTCLEAKAFFLHKNEASELVCYHYEKTTEDISLSNDTCECGIWVNQMTSLSCSPKIVFSTSIPEVCNSICANTRAYVFDIYTSLLTKITRCLEIDFTPEKIFAKLDTRIGRCKNTIITQNGTAGREYPCECGIRSPQRNYTTSMRNSSKAGPSNTIFAEDRLRNEDIFARTILENNVHSSNYPFGNVRDIQSPDKNLLFDLNNSPESVPQIEAFVVNSRTNLNYPVREIENFVGNSSVDANHPPKTVPPEIESFVGNSRIDLNNYPDDSVREIQHFVWDLSSELNYPTVSVPEIGTTNAINPNTDDLSNLNNPRLNDDYSANVSSSKEHPFTLEMESIEAYLTKDEYNIPVADFNNPLTLETPATEFHRESQSSLQVHRNNASLNDYENTVFTIDFLNDRNNNIFDRELRNFPTNSISSQPVGDFTLPSRYWEQDIVRRKYKSIGEDGTSYLISDEQSNNEESFGIESRAATENVEIFSSTNVRNHEPSKKRARKN